MKIELDLEMTGKWKLTSVSFHNNGHGAVYFACETSTRNKQIGGTLEKFQKDFEISKEERGHDLSQAVGDKKIIIETDIKEHEFLYFLIQIDRLKIEMRYKDSNEFEISESESFEYNASSIENAIGKIQERIKVDSCQ